MSSDPFLTPALNASITVLVDWLELTAFIDRFGVARVDALLSSIEQQQEEHEDDIARQDQLLDQIREAVENEVEARTAGCDGNYPFVLSDDGEELRILPNWADDRYSFYLVCLLTSHLTASPIVDLEIHDKLVGRLRNRVFQVVSVLAMAGVARGSSASVGWPRYSGEDVLTVLRRAEQRGAGLRASAKPGVYTRPREKDGGIDVIAWSLDDRPPPISFFYAQVASGNDWRGKPVMTFVETFERNYMDDSPRSNKLYATLIPFREIDFHQWFHEHSVHKTLIDRTRIPKNAWLGLQSARDGVEMDEHENFHQVGTWINDMRAELLAA